MQTPDPALVSVPAVSANCLFGLHYASGQAARQLLAGNNAVLGVVGYGTPRPDFLPSNCAYAPAPLLPQDGAPKIRNLDHAASVCRKLRVRIGFLARIAMISRSAPSSWTNPDNAPLEDIVERAYLEMFDFMDAAGFAAPLRFWNYLTAITAVDRGLERYRRFNIGRQKAFSARLRQALPPAASGVGGFPWQVADLFSGGAAAGPADRKPTADQCLSTIPKIYGPQSPSFSRAAVFSQHSMQALFISGTASIVGHQTRHAGDLSGPGCRDDCQSARLDRRCRAVAANRRCRAVAANRQMGC